MWSGDAGPALLAWWVCEPAVLGLVGSFTLHESAHVLALRRVRTVTRVAIERTAWRTSVIPEGTMTGREAAGVAAAGPLACVLAGLLLWLPDLDRALAWWYLAHLVFLAPCFGDGRALFGALRRRAGE